MLPWLSLRNSYSVSGYLTGFRQAAVVAEVAVSNTPVPSDRLDKLDEAVAQALPAYAASPAQPHPIAHVLLQRLCRIVAALQQKAGVPVFNDAVVLSLRPAAEGQRLCHLGLPCLGQDHTAVRAALRWAADAMNQILGGLPAEPALATLPVLVALARQHGPRGTNTVYFLRGADAADIPWQRVRNNVYEFGWGARARWLDSTFTDATSGMATKLARDKMATAAVLRRAGIPVASHFQAQDADHAVKLAHRLGYPVVVKPTDKDNGRGVAPGLKSDDAVRKAYAAALEHSASIIIEKHFTGEDYRLQVLYDDVFWATRRVPGGVTGDGVRTVDALLRELNADPRRGEYAGGAILQTLVMDEEAQDLLAEQGLALGAVPEAGRFVRLRRAANVSRGGIPEPVLEIAHPDNLLLGIRAARAMRLDMAGVDLLMPDIRRSWLETGAVICEVNSQPQLSKHVPAEILRKIVQGNGRIPVVVVVGNVLQAPWYATLLAAMGEWGRTYALVSPAGVQIGGQQVAGPGAVAAGMQAALADPAVHALLVVVGTATALSPGLPVDRVDALVLAPPTPGEPQARQRWMQWTRRLAPLSRQVWRVEEGQAEQGGLDSGDFAAQVESAEAVVASIRSMLH